MKRKSFGTCALTLDDGQFIKSHLIPRALTRLSKTGEKYIQSGIGERMTTAFDSWYDLKLVIQKGEDILSDIDSDGIDQLRSHHLIWSGWRQHDSIYSLLGIEAGIPFREVRIEDSRRLRLFFLSLLWRAGASRLDAFRHVTLDDRELEDLRLRVLHKDPGQADDYPICLYQIATRGAPHNRTPLLEASEFLDADQNPSGEQATCVRFYFEGLVARIYLGTRSVLPDWLPRIAVNDGNNCLVALNAFESSRTRDDLMSMIIDRERRLDVTDAHQSANPVLRSDSLYSAN